MSPNFPNNYPNNARCSHFIQLPYPKAMISLATRSFRLENKHLCSCSYDFVKIFDGCSISDTQIGSLHGYCGGNKPPTTLVPTGNCILILFVSDNSITSSGFNITYNVTGKSLPWLFKLIVKI